MGAIQPLLLLAIWGVGSSFLRAFGRVWKSRWDAGWCGMGGPLWVIPFHIGLSQALFECFDTFVDFLAPRTASRDRDPIDRDRRRRDPESGTRGASESETCNAGCYSLLALAVCQGPAPRLLGVAARPEWRPQWRPAATLRLCDCDCAGAAV